MPRLPKQNYHDIERIIEMDFLRATEAAALNSLKWLGRGDKEAADAAASDAIRGMFDLMNICGDVDRLLLRVHVGLGVDGGEGVAVVREPLGQLLHVLAERARLEDVARRGAEIVPELGR